MDYTFNGTAYTSDPMVEGATYFPFTLSFTVPTPTDTSGQLSATNLVWTVNGQPIPGGTDGHFNFAGDTWGGIWMIGGMNVYNDTVFFHGPVDYTNDDQGFNSDGLGQFYYQGTPYEAFVIGHSTDVPAPADFIAIILWCIMACGALAFSTRDSET